MVDTTAEEFDLVIVGSGAGALAAALAADDLGRSAIVLEKQDLLGGSTAISGGVLWIPDNPMMSEEGVADSYERARTYFDAAVPVDAPFTSSARRETFLRVGPALVSFLRDRGMQFFRPEGWSDYYDELPGGEPRSRCLMAPLYDARALGDWAKHLARSPVGEGLPVHSHELTDLYLVRRTWRGKRMALELGRRRLSAFLRRADLVSNGAALQGRLLELVLARGIPVRRSTAVVGLLEEGGRVVGVEIEGQATGVVRARQGVLLNAGGFCHNAALREATGRSPASAEWTAANPGDTGEVLNQARALGAATDNLDAFWWVLTSKNLDGSWPEGTMTPTGRTAPWMHHLDLALPHSILVDQRGERFCNESASYMEVGERIYAREQENGLTIPAWTIMDSVHRSRYPWGTALPGTTPAAWLESGYMKRADTIEDLAKACGIEGAGLTATIDRWNASCEKGVDDEHGRGERVFDRIHGDPTVGPNPCMGSVAKPPFYAVPMFPSDVGTAGGLVTDEYARVVREDGTMIDGLYATGNTTASIFARSYPGAGASIAASLVFGFVAAKHALGDAASIDALVRGDAA